MTTTDYRTPTQLDWPGATEPSWLARTARQLGTTLIRWVDHVEAAHQRRLADRAERAARVREVDALLARTDRQRLTAQSQRQFHGLV